MSIRSSPPPPPVEGAAAGAPKSPKPSEAGALEGILPRLLTGLDPFFLAFPLLPIETWKRGFAGAAAASSKMPSAAALGATTALVAALESSKSFLDRAIDARDAEQLRVATIVGGNTLFHSCQKE